MPTFTMGELIVRNGLTVDLRDSTATRMIAAKLKKAGYKRVRRRHNGKIQHVWTNEFDRLEELKSQLASIKL